LRGRLISIGQVAATPVALGIDLPAVGPAAPTQASACNSKTPGIACRLAWDLSHSSYAADFTNAYLAGPIRLTLRIALVVGLALLLRIAAQRLIRRVTARTAIGQDRERPGAVFGERRSQRRTALALLLGNAASVTIFIIAGLIILGDIGVNLAPVLASAGVLGLAIGFGAQNLVQDFLAGIFILLEDQYGVGDIIDIAGVTGSVEAVSLRTTRLRDVNGVVWNIRNGPIKRAGNETHGWARAVVDFPVPAGMPVAAARSAMERAAVEMAGEPRWSSAILERPEVWGIETISPDTLLVRVTARTAPLAKLEVTRELRERLKTAVDAERPPRPDGPGPAPHQPGPAVSAAPMNAPGPVAPVAPAAPVAPGVLRQPGAPDPTVTGPDSPTD
jgi:small conductance mechanosensitive channel